MILNLSFLLIEVLSVFATALFTSHARSAGQSFAAVLVGGFWLLPVILTLFVGLINRSKKFPPLFYYRECQISHRMMWKLWWFLKYAPTAFISLDYILNRNKGILPSNEPESVSDIETHVSDSILLLCISVLSPPILLWWRLQWESRILCEPVHISLSDLMKSRFFKYQTCRLFFGQIVDTSAMITLLLSTTSGPPGSRYASSLISAFLFVIWNAQAIAYMICAAGQPHFYNRLLEGYCDATCCPLVLMFGHPDFRRRGDFTALMGESLWKTRSCVLGLAVLSVCCISVLLLGKQDEVGINSDERERKIRWLVWSALIVFGEFLVILVDSLASMFNRKFLKKVAERKALVGDKLRILQLELLEQERNSQVPEHLRSSISTELPLQLISRLQQPLPSTSLSTFHLSSSDILLYERIIQLLESSGILGSYRIRPDTTALHNQRSDINDNQYIITIPWNQSNFNRLHQYPITANLMMSSSTTTSAQPPLLPQSETVRFPLLLPSDSKDMPPLETILMLIHKDWSLPSSSPHYYSNLGAENSTSPPSSGTSSALERIKSESPDLWRAGNMVLHGLRMVQFKKNQTFAIISADANLIPASANRRERDLTGINAESSSPIIEQLMDEKLTQAPRNDDDIGSKVEDSNHIRAVNETPHNSDT